MCASRKMVRNWHKIMLNPPNNVQMYAKTISQKLWPKCDLNKNCLSHQYKNVKSNWIYNLRKILKKHNPICNMLYYNPFRQNLLYVMQLLALRIGWFAFSYEPKHTMLYRANRSFIRVVSTPIFAWMFHQKLTFTKIDIKKT